MRVLVLLGLILLWTPATAQPWLTSRQSDIDLRTLEQRFSLHAQGLGDTPTREEFSERPSPPPDRAFTYIPDRDLSTTDTLFLDQYVGGHLDDRGLHQWVTIETAPIKIGWEKSQTMRADFEVGVTGANISLDDCVAEIRYSTDGEHWSEWLVVSFAESTADSHVFRCNVAIPRENRDRYDRFRNEYWGNMAEYVIYLKTAHPEVLTDDIPILRYAQARVSTNHPELKSVLSEVRFTVTYLMGGVHQ